VQLPFQVSHSLVHRGSRTSASASKLLRHRFIPDVPVTRKGEKR